MCLLLKKREGESAQGSLLMQRSAGDLGGRATWISWWIFYRSQTSQIYLWHGAAAAAAGWRRSSSRPGHSPTPPLLSLKRKGGKKKKSLASTSLHTPKYIHRGWCRRHFKSPQALSFCRFFSFSVFFLCSIWSSSQTTNVGGELSSLLYSVAPMRPGARSCAASAGAECIWSVSGALCYCCNSLPA